LPGEQFHSAGPVRILLDRVCHIYPRHSKYLLAALEDVQAYHGFIPRSVVPVLSEWFHVSSTSVQQWMDTQGLFQIGLPAKHLLKVCCGPVCSENGGKGMLAGLQELSENLDVGISLQASPCLGRCNEAPVARLNSQYLSRFNDAVLRQHLLDFMDAGDIS